MTQIGALRSTAAQFPEFYLSLNNGRISRETDAIAAARLTATLKTPIGVSTVRDFRQEMGLLARPRWDGEQNECITLPLNATPPAPRGTRAELLTIVQALLNGGACRPASAVDEALAIIGQINDATNQ